MKETEFNSEYSVIASVSDIHAFSFEGQARSPEKDRHYLVCQYSAMDAGGDMVTVFATCSNLNDAQGIEDVSYEGLIFDLTWLECSKKLNPAEQNRASGVEKTQCYSYGNTPVDPSCAAQPLGNNSKNGAGVAADKPEHSSGRYTKS